MMKRYATAWVFGLGGSGAAAVRLLRREGADVLALDQADTPALRETAQALEALGARVQLGATQIASGTAEIGVVSPGLELASPLLAEAHRRGVPLLSELELGWSRHRGRTIAVTGSNGKSTVVKWLSESLGKAGLRALPGGNYGTAACQVVLERPDLDWLVLEVSSFQLETAQHFRVDIGILLNLVPNHLNRHGDMATYAALKARLFARAGTDDICLVHEPWLERIRALAGGAGRWFSFGSGERADYRYEKGRVWHEGRLSADVSGTYFGNEVLGQNAAAVVAALACGGVGPPCAEQAARHFIPLPHRMQPVATINGVAFVNDSKATTLAAMAAALQMTTGRVRLIAGGIVKEKDLFFVKEVLAQKAACVYLIGQASKEMTSAWSDVVPCVECGTLNEAVHKARSDARTGETVLLSPACASFDQFRNFEERGERFMRLVCGRAEEDF